MSFDPVVFGTYVIGTGFTDGDSLPSGGLSPYIRILADTGNQPSDVTITYVDQNGNSAEQTLVSTSVPANSTAGTYIKISLNGGDSGVRDITAVSVTGGTAGDSLELTSNNEGIGKALTLASGLDNAVWEDIDPKKEDSIKTISFDNAAELGNSLFTNVLNSVTPPAMDFQLQTEIITLDCIGEILNFGFHSDICQIVQNSDMISAEVAEGYPSAPVPPDEPAARFKWRGDGTPSGFFRFEFYYAVKPGNMHTFEVKDKDEVTKLSKTTNVGGWTRPALHSSCGENLLHPASKAVDGNQSTYWAHDEPENHWLILDLGASKGIDAIRIASELTFTNLVSVWVSDTPAYFENQVIEDATIPLPIVWNKLSIGELVIGRYVLVEFTSPNGTPMSISDVNEIEIFVLEKADLSFVSTGWEARLRVSTAGTTAGDEFMKMYNLKIERYKLSGEVETLFVDEHPNLTRYGRMFLTSTKPAGTKTALQFAFSDDGTIWSDFTGPDGTSTTKYYSPDFITLPAGFTGYNFKWKAILESDGRYTPTYNSHLLYLWEKHPGIVIDLMRRVPEHFLPETQSMMPISFMRGCPRATPGFPAPACAGGSFLTFDTAGHADVPALFYIMDKACPRPTEGYPAPACPNGSFLAFDAIANRQIWYAKFFLLASSWLESVVGQVVSGYCKDQDENIIIGAVKVILTSSTTDGMDVMGEVEPGTGLYQLFVKNVLYDGRDLIVTIEGKPYNMSYAKYGTPDLIDGTAPISSPLDLHFRKPASVCRKCVAHVDSLVTY